METFAQFVAWLVAILGADHASVTALSELETTDETTAAEGVALMDEDAITALVTALQGAAADVGTDDLLTLADTVDYLNDTLTERAEAAAAEEATRAELLARITGQTGDDGDGGGDDGDGGDGDGGDGDGAAPEGDAAGANAEPEPVLAAGRPAPARPAPGAVAPTAGRAAPSPTATPAGAEGPEFVALRATGTFARGDRVRPTALDGSNRSTSLGALMADAIADMPPGEFPKERIARFHGQVPEERQLRSGERDENSRKVALAVERTRRTALANTEAGNAYAARLDALVAAGGLCAPLEPYYQLQFLGDAGRPVRDFLPSFQADRGGIIFQPPPSLVEGDYTGGVSIWTAANDANPTDPTTKPFLEMICNENEEVPIYAVTDGVKVPNFRQRSFPEQVENTVQGSRLVHARTAETQLIQAIDAASIAQVENANSLGFARDLLFALEKYATIDRDLHRMEEGTTLDVLLPHWVPGAMRSDILRQMPGDGLESLAVAQAMIDSWFRERGLRVGYFRDTQNFAGFVADGRRDWHQEITWYMFPTGSYLFLDGGELNVGVFRDLSLVELNQYAMFSETFEALAAVGVVTARLKVTQTVCVNGATSGTIDPDTICGVS